VKIQFVTQSTTTSQVDLLAFGLFQGNDAFDGELADVDNALGGAVSDIVKQGDITGKFKETLVLHTFGKIPAKRILLVGLGESGQFTDEKARIAAAIVVRQAKKFKAQTVASTLFGFESLGTLAAQRFAEGAYLADYHFEGYASNKDEEPPSKLGLIHVHVKEMSDELTQALQLGQAYAQGTNFARTLVNTPANMMTPTIMADYAIDLAKRYGMEYEVLERADMERFEMGGILAVASGSQEPPKMIVLKYQGRDNWDDVIGFVGKGITFDSGGLSIKSASGMEEMKMDMGGGAAVLGAMEVIGQLKPNVNVVAVVGCTENMPSGSSYRPGDIIKTMSGKTIEVLNTDAEGRIVLADAIAYAKHLGATRLIDVATLTGAVVVALGNVTTAAMTNNEGFLADFMSAAKRAGEKVWQLPTFDEYKEQIKSQIADVVNTGIPGAGSITAALFVGTFVEDTPWIHLDIAGTAWVKKDTEVFEKGATGVMVRSLAELARQYAK
jgi:leucyl aminopeptidase